MNKTKQKIFQVAVDLFSKKGFSGVSVREIARKVGIKESSIYNHYKSKDDLLSKIFDFFQEQMQKASPPKDYLEDIIKTLTPQQFWEKGLANFQQATKTPMVWKISKIVLLEMFQNQRARDIALHEFFTRQQNLVKTVFKIMQENGSIRKEVDAGVLAREYAYGMLGLQFELNLLNNWKLNTSKVQEKMHSHIKFISDIATNRGAES